MDSSSIRETRGFDIQTRDVRKPPEALRGPLKCNMRHSPFTTKYRKFRWGCKCNTRFPGVPFPGIIGILKR